MNFLCPSFQELRPHSNLLWYWSTDATYIGPAFPAHRDNVSSLLDVLRVSPHDVKLVDGAV